VSTFQTDVLKAKSEDKKRAGASQSDSDEQDEWHELTEEQKSRAD